MKQTSRRGDILSPSRSHLTQLNLLLIALALMFLVLYIFSINKVAVLEYSFTSTKAKLTKLNTLNESLAEEKQISVPELLSLAAAKNMVEVKNYDTFFQETGVALSNH